jgi:hypothetical protein
MGRGAFILLKVGRVPAESAKQAERYLAEIPKISCMFREGRTLRAGAKATGGCLNGDFHRVLLIYRGGTSCTLEPRSILKKDIAEQKRNKYCEKKVLFLA